MKKLRMIGSLVLPVLVMIYFYNRYQARNPFDEVEWIEDTPGATGRYVTFTPVLKSNKKAIGPTVGADYGVLKFRDLDGDGIHEAIIETDNFIHLEFYTASRQILKYKTDKFNSLKFELILAEGVGENQ